MLPFVNRHTGISANDEKEMLDAIGVGTIEELIDEAIPSIIRHESNLSNQIPQALSVPELLSDLKRLAQKNSVFRSFIGQGYYGTVTPPVIQRNIFENPGWYTQYTPYQAEISQGRLEALLNFQTVVSELTGFPLANASLLDEGTAAAEAMVMSWHTRNKKRKNPKEQANIFIVDQNVYDHTADVLKSRASALNIEIDICDVEKAQLTDRHFGILIQYPGKTGSIRACHGVVQRTRSLGIITTMAADLLALTLIASPASLGAHIAVGTTQRLGIPMGAGGPHAAYFACDEQFKRKIPGRIIGVSKDRFGQKAYRMALQTREQHIKREKATSNICTAQALLAIMAGFYAIWHGPDGLRQIAVGIHEKTKRLAERFIHLGLPPVNHTFFDTLTLKIPGPDQTVVKSTAEAAGYNFFYGDNTLSISCDELTTDEDIERIAGIFQSIGDRNSTNGVQKPAGINEYREVDYMEQPIFHRYHDETRLMRYIKTLENRDLSLVHAMIPLGSCTMKLNAAAQLMALSWPEFASIHPFAPADQRRGYMEMIDDLSTYLCQITGLSACSFMPNSGAQGEYTGLRVIDAYHKSTGDDRRTIVIIPESAHGTNPASAVMAGMEVVVAPCDEKGNVIVKALRELASDHKDELAAMMITYPSTHGVFEEEIKDITSIIHENGGLVYLDGANMNAQIGYTSPSEVGADVCHLNLHKTFAIPHGGGGPGMGPICCHQKLAPFLPGHRYEDTGSKEAIDAISSAPYGSASILLISYAYIRLLGPEGLKRSTQLALLNANYLMEKLTSHYPILYTGKKGRCAHEFILDLRYFKGMGIQAEDVAKRLIDYGFHPPTLSFPVAGTFMIEPTESESKEELDLFVEAMVSIKEETDTIASGKGDKEDNVLKNAPHPIKEVTADAWSHVYSREEAAYPLPYLLDRHKFWVEVGRIDSAWGDRHLICTCPPMEAYISR